MGLAEPRHIVTLAAVLVAAPLGVLAVALGSPALAAAAPAAAALVLLWRVARRDPVLVLGAMWAFQVVRTPLANTVPGAAGGAIDQLTDVVALVLIGAVMWDMLVDDGRRHELRLLLPAGALAVCGLLSGLLADAPLAPTATGLWLGVKLWVLVGLAAAVRWRPEDVERVLRIVLLAGAAAALLGLLDFITSGRIADLANSSAGVTAFAYRSHAAQSLYATPNDFSMAMSMLVAIAAARVVARRSPRDIALLVLFIVAAMVSLRLKAVLCVASVLGVAVAVLAMRNRRRAVGMLVAAAVVLACVVAVEGPLIQRQLGSLGTSDSAARTELYRVATEIGADHLPLGVGFGRFGTAPSRSDYSTVYDDYGVSGVWGLSREFPRFISDTSWPAVLGETGWAGVVVCASGFLALLVLGASRLRGAHGTDVVAPLALLCVVVAVLVDSVANSTLFSWNATLSLAIAVGATVATRPLGALSPVAAARERSGLQGARPVALG